MWIGTHAFKVGWRKSLISEAREAPKRGKLKTDGSTVTVLRWNVSADQRKATSYIVVGYFGPIAHSCCEGSCLLVRLSWGGMRCQSRQTLSLLSDRHWASPSPLPHKAEDKKNGLHVYSTFAQVQPQVFAMKIVSWIRFILLMFSRTLHELVGACSQSHFILTGSTRPCTSRH